MRFQVAPGVMLKPVGRVGSRRLKKLLQEYGVPSWQRGRIPILYYGEQVALVAGSLSATDFWRQKRGGVGVAAPVTPDAD
nr:tRNA lysidine(34) synthetase TilS [Aeromonas caviae]